FEGRVGRTFDLSQLSATTGKEVLPPTTWMVNSVRNRPLEAQEPHLLGQTRTTTRSETAKASPTPAPAVTPQQGVSATPPPSPHDVRSGVSRMVSVTPATSTPGLNGDQHSSNGHSQGKVAPASVGPAHDDASQVMLRFQDLMARFLDTQKSVMTTYLTGTAQGTTAPLAPLPEIPRRAVEMPRATVVQVSTPTAPPKGTPPPTPVVATPEAKAPVEKAPEAKPATREASAKFVPDRAWITNQLQDLISKRTGYPRDMLSLDIDLEADLGIDSIKRVEILAEMAQALGGGEEGLPAGLEMEKLTAIGTLRGIIDYLEAGFSKSNSNGKKAESSRAKKTGTASAPGVATNGDGPVIQRAVAALVECPLLARPSSLLGSGVVLLSDDGQGIARHIAGRLADLGKASLILPGSGKEGEAKGMDLTDPQAVTAILNQAREQFGSIDGFLHLMPLQPLGEQSWDVRAKRDTRSLYLLARALEDDLRAAGKKGHAFFMAATNLGGAFGFGSDSLPGNYQPGQGGIAGFLKCLGQEWPEVSVRAVDFDSTQESLPDIADRMLVEMSIAEGAFEVGYHRGKRLTWAPRAVTIDKSGTPVDLLQPGDPVLITGGARGITAEIAIELSRRYRPTLILLGRSPLPEEAEEENTASLKSPAEIKVALIARMEREGRPPAPSQIEAAFNRLMQNREIRDNLRRMREAGATVHYHSVDVRDASAFGQLLDQIQSKHGGLVGVIHGAGVIEDRLVRSKTPESFDRVFETKVVSARVLAEKLNRDRLKFLVLFASLASRYGNKGQADYAAANEVLAKLAHQLDRQWTARVMAIAWGPWSQVGMVADLEKHLVQRGLRLISPQEGPGLLIDELVHGKKGDREIVLAGGAEAIVQPGRREAMTAQPAAGK
ncbi:MAG: SDR family NAD(P)-dependent oxidoreductase, partial [Gemmataceae bacterium]